ncbi:MAG: pyridoxal-phosphate dependent enzyme [Sulfolobales archaeon]
MGRVDLRDIVGSLKFEIELREFIEIASRVLREGGFRCIDLNNLSREDLRILKVLYMMGCRHVYSCEKDSKDWYSLEDLGFYDDISPQPYRVFRDSEELLYRNWPTPLLRIRSLSSGGVRAWAKLEYYNPYSMSIKDRIGWYMVKVYSEEKGEKLTGRTIYEATSTNTGIALAAMSRLNDFKAVLFIPSTIQKASDILLEVMGGKVERRPKTLTIEMIDEVEQISRSSGGVHLNQFYNDANFLVHFRYTAKELDLQIRSAGLKMKGLIAGIGTSGHFSALSIYFKNRLGSHVKAYAVQPAPGEIIPGIRRIETGMKWIHMASYEGIIDIRLREAIEGALDIARSEGILVGLSSGAVARAFKKLVSEGVLDEGDYVLIFPDNGFKYIEQFSRYFSGEIK